MKWFAVICALFWAGGALAQDAGAGAREAAELLRQAAIKLGRAEGTKDRIKALSETVLAYETGLSEMRRALRHAALREEQLRRRLASKDKETAVFLSALQSLGSGPSPTVFLHPQGPTGTARAGMLLSEMTPLLNARAVGLRSQLEEVQALRELQQQSADQLQEGLKEVQQARVSLSKAMADRTDLPVRFTQDPVRTAILIASTETLDAFARGLERLPQALNDIKLPSLDGRLGKLSLPAKGVILRGMNEPDAAGILRPGIILATRPGALVQAPAAATIRYVGPLLDYGNVVILEPQQDMLFVFAGLDITYGIAGQVIKEGTPLGLMGGGQMSGDAENVNVFNSLKGDATGNERSETLYIEVRKQNVALDPMKWFRTDKDR